MLIPYWFTYVEQILGWDDVRILRKFLENNRGVGIGGFTFGDLSSKNWSYLIIENNRKSGDWIANIYK